MHILLQYADFTQWTCITRFFGDLCTKTRTCNVHLAVLWQNNAWHYFSETRHGPNKSLCSFRDYWHWQCQCSLNCNVKDRWSTLLLQMHQLVAWRLECASLRPNWLWPSHQSVISDPAQITFTYCTCLCSLCSPAQSYRSGSVLAMLLARGVCRTRAKLEQDVGQRSLLF